MKLDRIQQINEVGRFSLWYHPTVPVNQIHPLMTLDRLLWICNTALAAGLDHADANSREELARLLRINWFVQDLNSTGRIVKPILLHLQGLNYATYQGDTRLMALEVCSWIPTVSALISLQPHHCAFFPDWIHIANEDQLTDLLGLEKDCILMKDNVADHVALDWIEFQSGVTAHHLHDESLRVKMMWNYLSDQSMQFRFDRAWVSIPIDWQQYQ